MPGGLLSVDNVTSVFRNISQKRKSGLLEISEDKGELRIIFSSGKISRVEHSRENAGEEICSRIARAEGLSVNDEPFAAVVAESRSLEEMYDRLVHGGIIDHDLFVRAKEAYELDLLHSLRSIDDVPYDFRTEVVEVRPALSLSISTAQLLLDLVQSSEDAERFEKLFGELDCAAGRLVDPLDAEGVNIHKKHESEEHNSPLNQVEEIIVRCLGITDQLGRISEIALISEFELRRGVLALLDKGYVTRGARNIGSKADETAHGEEAGRVDAVLSPEPLAQGFRAPRTGAQDSLDPSPNRNTSRHEIETPSPSLDHAPAMSVTISNQESVREEPVLNTATEGTREALRGVVHDLARVPVPSDDDASELERQEETTELDVSKIHAWAESISEISRSFFVVGIYLIAVVIAGSYELRAMFQALSRITSGTP